MPPDFDDRPILRGDLVASVSLRAFVKAWNDRQHLPMPALHREILGWLEEAWLERHRELLLLVFRDAGKSTLVGLFAAWLLLRDPGLRILVLSADQALARKMVRNVKRIVERHPLTAALRPLRRDQWAADQFTVQREAEWRDPSMLARGLSGNITGSRADIVICDDVEVPATCETAEKREALRERLSEIEYVLVPDGTQLFVGTPHSYYSIYAAQPRPETGEAESFLAGFRRLELPVLLPDGGSRWPERFPLERLQHLRRRRGPARFAAQMLLQPTAASDGRLDPDHLVPYGDELSVTELAGDRLRLEIGSRRMVSAACWWDPAYGAPRKGDGSVIAALYADADGHYWLHALQWLEHDPKLQEDAASQLCRQAAQFLRQWHMPAVRLETNGLGRFLPGLLRRALRQEGYAAGVIECTSHRAKAVRILEAFDAVLAAGALHVHDRVLATPFLRELREWRPGLTGQGARQQRDDSLDAVAGCLLSEPVRIGGNLDRSLPDAMRRDWRGSDAAHRAETDFDP